MALYQWIEYEWENDKIKRSENSDRFVDSSLFWRILHQIGSRVLLSKTTPTFKSEAYGERRV
jgi:hypothetical protein